MKVTLLVSILYTDDTSHTYTDAFAIVSRWDKLLIFGGCNVAALACFVICFALFPVLSLKYALPPLNPRVISER